MLSSSNKYLNACNTTQSWVVKWRNIEINCQKQINVHHKSSLEIKFWNVLISRKLSNTSNLNMWHEARKQEKKIRGMIVDYRKRADRRKEFYERIVSLIYFMSLVCTIVHNQSFVSSSVARRSNSVSTATRTEMQDTLRRLGPHRRVTHVR